MQNDDLKSLITAHSGELKELRRIADRVDVLLNVFVTNTEKRLEKLETTQKVVYMMMGGLTILNLVLGIGVRFLK